ncbi:MAG: tRNA (adenosine(37)-N6)-dimethylallyltransferase MiaA [bacterium]
MLKKIIVIGGATCSGKTEISVELSKLFPVEIINFDSMCFYKYFDIGTAKPDNETRASVKHHLIDVKYPDEEYNARMFSEDAAGLIEEITSKGKTPLFTGGTGLYMKSLIYGLSPIPEIDKSVYRRKAVELIKKIGITAAYEKLKEFDPEYAGKISSCDSQRISRAYEVYSATGHPLSYYLAENPFGRPLYDYIYFNLNPPRDYLKSRITERTRIIMENGLVNETESILNRGYKADLKPFRSIGYRESLMYLQKEIKTENDLYLKIVSSTVKYAKRQATFFKKTENAMEVNFTDLNRKLGFIAKTVEGFL